jgi:hypothetical protein
MTADINPIRLCYGMNLKAQNFLTYPLPINVPQKGQENLDKDILNKRS